MKQQEQAVDAKTAARPSPKYPLGGLVEGKTKKIHQVAGSADLVTSVAKDDITAGDGAKHDVIPDKGKSPRDHLQRLPLLKACGLPVGFEEQDSAISFVAPKCAMLPLRGCGAARSPRLLSQAQPAFLEGPAV